MEVHIHINNFNTNNKWQKFEINDYRNTINEKKNKMHIGKDRKKHVKL